MKRGLKVIYEVVWSAPNDLDAVARFRSKEMAEYFAARHKHYQQPCDVKRQEVPTYLAQRWGVA
jgi:hypothetical protein